MDSEKHYFKIGLFVIAAAAIFITVLFRFDSAESDHMREISIRFDNASGLAAGASVKLAGVPVGQVHSVDVVRVGETFRVNVKAKIRPDIDIADDAVIRISSHGLLGSKHLEIVPGTGGEAGEGLLFEGDSPLAIDDMVNTGNRIAQKMEITVDAINEILGDHELKDKIRANADELAGLITELNKTSRLLNKLLEGIHRGEGLMGKIMKDEEVFEDVRELVKDIKKHPWKLLKKR